ncbi:MAG: hypothetical protein O7F12_03005 [Nitrospirae bacterium]|nr:hypothetical protein [Nitrospirota bacterium]
MDSFKGMLRRLQKRETDVALIAQMALAHGIFSSEVGDGLKPYIPNEEWQSLQTFLQSKNTFTFSPLTIGTFFALGMLQPFRTFYRLGATLRQANAFGTFHQIIRVLRKIHIQISWIPIVALSHGAVSQHTNKQHCQQAEKILKQFNACEKPVGTIQTIKTLWSIVRS